MEEAVSSFCSRLPKNSFAFFFFAGHGIQTKGVNYLVPTESKLSSEASLKYRTVSLDYVQDELEQSRSSLNVIVLDCCRDNPFERSLNRSMGQRGLAAVNEPPEGMIIAYATGRGKKASDGVGENSPYTYELAAALASRPKDGLTLIDGVFFKLGRTLKPKTDQHPHLYVDSTMPRYFLWKPDSGEVDDQVTSIASNASAEPASSKHQKPEVARPKSEPPKVASKSEMKDSPQYEQAKLRLEQADRFHGEGHFDLAVEAYGALINDPQVPSELRKQARRGRGASYLARGTQTSINLAIIDFQAAGERGIQLPVLKSEETLKVQSVTTGEQETKGKIRRNEIVLITKSQVDWLWVASVQGNSARQGWVRCDAFLSTTPTPASKSVSSGKPTQPKTLQPAIASTARPSTPQPTSVTPSASIPSPSSVIPPSSSSSTIQAFGTVAPNIAGSSSPTSSAMIQLDSNGRVIGQNPPANSQSVRRSSSPVQQVPQSSGQIITYDANGRQIIQPAGSVASRSLTPTQPQTVRPSTAKRTADDLRGPIWQPSRTAAHAAKNDLHAEYSTTTPNLSAANAATVHATTAAVLTAATTSAAIRSASAEHTDVSLAIQQ